MTNLIKTNFKAHPLYLVSPSPWPLLLILTIGVLTMHGFITAKEFLFLALLTLISSMSFWFRDVISEATYFGNHTLAVQRGLNMDVALFIISEGLFFLGIFWALTMRGFINAISGLLISPSKPHTLVDNILESKIGAGLSIHIGSSLILFSGGNIPSNLDNINWVLHVNYPQFINNSFSLFIDSLETLFTSNVGSAGSIYQGVSGYSFNIPKFIGVIVRELPSLDVNTGLMGVFNGISITHVYVAPLSFMVPLMAYWLLPLLTGLINRFFDSLTKLTKSLVKSIHVTPKPSIFSPSNSNYKSQPALQDNFKGLSDINSKSAIDAVLWGFNKRFAWVASKIQVVIPYHLTNITVYMAQCAHAWKDIGSNQPNLVNWRCSGCNSGPHIAILECIYCKIKRCRNCTLKR